MQAEARHDGLDGRRLRENGCKVTSSPEHAAQARAELQKPTALVLAGPQDCGKTILARMLAAERSTFTEVRIEQLMHKGHLTQLLCTLPRTVVLDDEFELRDVLADDHRRAALKQLITASHQVINDRGAMRHVRSPKLIFCTGEVDYLPGADISRRFSVVKMGPGIESGAKAGIES